VDWYKDVSSIVSPLIEDLTSKDEDAMEVDAGNGKNDDRTRDMILSGVVDALQRSFNPSKAKNGVSGISCLLRIPFKSDNKQEQRSRQLAFLTYSSKPVKSAQAPSTLPHSRLCKKRSRNSTSKPSKLLKQISQSSKRKYKIYFSEQTTTQP
jgi:hypothetical protein